MLVNENNSVPYLKSLGACLEKMVAEGYTDDFKALDGPELRSLRTDRKYKPEDVRIVNFYRFEGVSDPDDMSILYILETTDGLKGTLVDAFGTYASAEVNEFMLAVESINKKVVKEDK